MATQVRIVRSRTRGKGNLVPKPLQMAELNSDTCTESSPNIILEEPPPLNESFSADSIKEWGKEIMDGIRPTTEEVLHETIPNWEGTRLKTAKEWEDEILSQIWMFPQFLTTTEVKQSELITDVRELFGQDLNREVSLRTAEEIKQGRPVNLVKFHPNFKPGKVVCRNPDCKNVKPEAESGEDKRDLYLCQSHRADLGDLVEKTCEKKQVKVGVSFSSTTDRFDGYTTMIGHLDNAYRICMTSPYSPRSGWRPEPLVKETILNVRNYLMVVNAVLNPDEENLGIALPPVFEILRLILQKCDDRQFVENLVYLLKEVFHTILFAFGVLYAWVSIALSNPCAQIGAGFGGFFGSVTGFFSAGLAGALAGGVGGAAFGGMIGNGISNLFRGQPWNPGIGPGAGPANILLYQFEGNSSGVLNLRLVKI